MTKEARKPAVGFKGHALASANARARLPQTPEGLEIEGASAYALTEGLRGDAGTRHTVDQDEILQLELEGGVLWYVAAADLVNGAGDITGSRGEAAPWLPSHLSFAQNPDRSLVGGLAIKALTAFGVKIGAKLTGKALAAIAESKVPEPGLYHAPSPERLEARAVKLSNKAPFLLFLHGTFVNTVSSFGGLAKHAGGETWKILSRIYREGRVLAFDHRTVSQSPIENAVELLRALPKDAELHVLSHSRGGLVGELLCLPSGGLWLEASGKVFEGHPDEKPLKDLARLLKEKKPRVERFVRVACPAAGTLLAGERLDRYLSVLHNVAGLLGSAQPLADFLASLAIAAAKERTDPRSLPGLEAMMPGSAAVRLLNWAGHETSSDLTAIAGDLDGGGIWNRLKLLVTDLFYRENHDLVVNTSAMVTGIPRALGRSRFFFDKGPRVDHFSYFANDSSASRVVWGLTRSEGNRTGFEELRPETKEALKTRAPRSLKDLPVVFVLPGIMGSHLQIGDNRVWFDPFELALRGMRRLKIGTPNVSVEAVEGTHYNRLVDFLAMSHDVVPFPYDWRIPLEEEAARLADEVRKRLEGTRQPVRFIAHSMGGVLARTMMGNHGALWREVVERRGRLVLLGTPNSGSYVVVSVLLGLEGLIRKLELISLRESLEDLISTVQGFPGLLQLLPHETQPLDFGNAGTWMKIRSHAGTRWPAPDVKDLAAFNGLRALFARTPLKRGEVVYVAGVADETPIMLETASAGHDRFLFRVTSEGDGRVPWKTAGVESDSLYFVDAVHGNLPKERQAFPGYLDLLVEGTTTRLSKNPPSTRGMGGTRDAKSAGRPPDQHPTPQEILAAALGSTPAETSRAGTEPKRDMPLRVEVVHGDVSFATGPVIVGHYEGDVFVGAERRIDDLLGGRLKHRENLGLYPGADGTTLAVFNPDPQGKPEGALVVGLGAVGGLTAGKLERGICDAAKRFMVAANERPHGSAPFGGTVYALLLGTGDSVMGVEDSITSIISGLLEAKRQVAVEFGLETSLTDSISKLRLIELYEDRATEAAVALNRVALNRRFAEQITAASVLCSGSGGWRRSYAEDWKGWWTRLRIDGSREDGLLHFTTLTSGARAEERDTTIQAALVQAFVAEITGSQSPEDSGVLFELLVPNALKTASLAQRDMLLILDSASAQYPWEMLHNRAQGATEPLALQARMLRQLVTPKFREGAQMSPGRHVLVVGDSQSKAFAPLPGAQKEAELVARKFEDYRGTQGERFEVNAVFPRRPAAEIVRALMAEKYKVLHLSGHGVVDYERPEKAKVTGMVLGDDLFLTTSEVEQLRFVPELVFLNCCHLGAIGPQTDALRVGRERLAANLAEQFIRMGARCVVAAGWAVNDRAALKFAEVFYKEILGGRRFGHAVHEARRVIYDEFRETNTWGAYQCYGDPDWVLARNGAPLPSDRRFVSPESLVIELGNIPHKAKTDNKARQQDLLRGVIEMASSVAASGVSEWLERGDVRAAFGRAFFELGDYGKAVEHFDEGAKAKKALMCAADREQRANVQIRHNVREVQGGRKDRKAALSEINRALKDLDALEPQEGRSLERFRMLAAGYKRAALVSKGNAQSAKYLGEAREAYDAAVEAEEKSHSIYDPILNAAATQLLQRALDLRTPAVDRSRVATAREAAERADLVERSFWTAVTAADAALLEAVLDDGLAIRLPAVINDYLRAKPFGSAREMRSVLEHVEWMHAMLSRAPKDRLPGPDTRDALGRLADVIKRWLEDSE